MTYIDLVVDLYYNTILHKSLSLDNIKRQFYGPNRKGSLSLNNSNHETIYRRTLETRVKYYKFVITTSFLPGQIFSN